MGFKPQTLIWIIGLAITLGAVGLYLQNSALLNRLDLIYQDAQFRWRGPLSPGPEVVIAAIDEKSLDTLGKWPWPRKTLARVIDRLTERQADVIGLDIVLSDRETSPPAERLLMLKKELEEKGLNQPEITRLLDHYIEETDPDEQLARAIRNSRRTILGYFFHFDPAQIVHLSKAALMTGLESVRGHRFKGFVKTSEDVDLDALPLKTAVGIEANRLQFSKSAKGSGYFSFDVELDGSIRKQALVVKYRGPESGRNFFFPSLAIRMLETYRDATLLLKVSPLGVQDVILNGKDSIAIPTNQSGELFVNYLGGRKTFPHVSIADIVQPEGAGPDLKDKIVLVGATATAMEDIRLTPFDPALPGVEIHATLIDNILHDQMLHRPPWLFPAELAGLMVVGIILTYFFSRFDPLPCLVGWLGFTLLLFVFSCKLMQEEKILVSGGAFVFESLSLFAGLMIFRNLVEARQKKFIRNVFGHYLSPGVVDTLLQDPDKLKLGGEQKVLTCLFSDIAGFTTFSEKMNPTDQVSLLNEYFTEMMEVLMGNDGTLDKFDGDAVKAFFGAPVYFENHAEKACRTALQMMERLHMLVRKWEEEGRPTFKIRIGVNTGPMLIGNFGSRQRLNYGMNGDAVNLAARLEAINKQYGSYIMINETTHDAVEGLFEMRELDHIQVAGRDGHMRIYELGAFKGELAPQIQRVWELYAEGMKHYRNQNWDAARVAFRRALEVEPEDGPSQALLARCDRLEESPPAPDWNGVSKVSAK